MHSRHFRAWCLTAYFPSAVLIAACGVPAAARSDTASAAATMPASAPASVPALAAAPATAVVPATPVTGDPDPFEAWVAGYMAERRIPGLSVVVVRDGDIVRAGHYGLANVELNVPVNEVTSFRIGSMSKAFTAAALMLLVEDGRVRLDDRVTDHLAGLPESWGDITLRQLLDNTSGLSNDWDLNPGTPTEEWTVNSSDYFLRNTTDDDFLRALADLPLLFTPGERYSYAAGTFVVGRVIEKVAGVPYADFMRSRIFEPLGMTRTMINDSERIVPHRADGYRPHGDVLMRGYRLSPAADARGDIGVLTTALDLAKWDAAMRDTRLLSRSSLDLIATPARLNDGSSSHYGLGWNILPVRGLRTLSHGGSARSGFGSWTTRFVDADLTVIVVANLWGIVNEAHTIEIASFHHPAFRLASTMEPKADPDPARSRLLRSVVELIGHGSIDPERMTAEFPISVYIHASWQQRHETLRSFTFVDCQPHDPRSVDALPGSEVCFYRFDEPRGTGYMVFQVAADGRVIDVYTEEFRQHPETP